MKRRIATPRQPVLSTQYQVLPLSPAPSPLPPARPRHSRPYSLLPTLCSQSRSGFTLVEMLIALALTLILVYAIAHFYAIVGDSVKDGRGMIEMNQQLRAVVERLKDDLDRLTVPVVPWADEGGAEGYLEIREGRIFNPFTFLGTASDWDVNGNAVPDAALEFRDVDRDTNATPDGFDLNGDGVIDVTNLLGDTDDYIGMTIRAGTAAFKGQCVLVSTSGVSDGLVVPRNSPTAPLTKIGNPPTVFEITAPFAEVAWWTSFADQVDPASTASPPRGNGVWDLNETRFLHRRQLLIRPDLNLRHPGDTNPGTPIFTPSTTPYFCRIPIPSPITNSQAVYIYDLQQFCDVSLRLEAVTSTHAYFVANSLADLSKRQNRFMHVPAAYDSPPGSTTIVSNFPYALDLNPNYAGDLHPNLMPDNIADINNTDARHNSTNGAIATAGSGSLYRWVLMDGGRKGEDIMLPNVLAFDIRVFDPDAVLRPDAAASPSGVVQPGDPGYLYANSYNYQSTHSPYGGQVTGLPTGAYVDMGYGIPMVNALPLLPVPYKVTNAGEAASMLFGTVPPGSTNVSPFQPTLGLSKFANLPSVNPALLLSAPATNLYRSRIGYTYDTWTLAYERDGIDQDGDTLFDEGRDGLDNDPIVAGSILNAVDDASERETVPPYAHPLRGVQIRIRMYEPGTRQMRQSTVIGDFLPE